jgi:alpha-galactosidase
MVVWLVAIWAIGFSGRAWAVKPTAEEMARSDQWAKENFRAAKTTQLAAPGQEHSSADDFRPPPFSFVYGGKPSQELLRGWEFKETVTKLDDVRTRRTQTYWDRTSGLVVRCEIVQYQDYPTMEWTLHFKNGGTTDTTVLEDIQVLDTEFHRSASGEFLLHHNVGSPAAARDYGPLETRLEARSSKRITADGGRPTSTDLCYFNLELGGQGVILALGWPGQYAAEFARDATNGLRVRAGLEAMHFRLHPGEEVRAPLVVLQFWQGEDWVRAQNVWRRWFVAHNLRKPGGKLPLTHWSGTSDTGPKYMTQATEANQKQDIDAFVERGVKPDLWWMDAGWYPCNGRWPKTGTWEADKARFPNGLRAVTDYARTKGIKSVVWFDVERVAAGSWLARNHPQWILGVSTNRDDTAEFRRWFKNYPDSIHGGTNGGLLDLGNSDAWRWAVNHMDQLLTQEGIDIYTGDINALNPHGFWRDHDAPDRQGLTEIRYVQGLLAYWDELLRRHPDMLYDNCAGGGRRNDLETMRRGGAYCKSDYWNDPVGVQGQTYGISFWLPYFGAGWGTNHSPYFCRSKIAHHVLTCLDRGAPQRSSLELSRRLEEWRRIVPNYWGDYWPLTPYSLDNKVWMAWQFDRPEAGQGVVQAFRRAESPEESARYRLRGLEPDAQYALTDLDSGPLPRTTGRELMAKGLALTAKDRPSALVVLYEKVQ